MTEHCMLSGADYIAQVSEEMKTGQIPIPEGAEMLTKVITRLIAEDKEENPGEEDHPTYNENDLYLGMWSTLLKVIEQVA